MINFDAQHIWFGRGLWATLILFLIVILFVLWKKSRLPEKQGAY